MRVHKNPILMEISWCGTLELKLVAYLIASNVNVIKLEFSEI